MSSPNVDRAQRLQELKQELSRAQGGERLHKWMEYTVLENEDPENRDWLASCYPHMKIHSWSTEDPKNPKVVFSYTVQKENCNRSGNLHGGCTASIFDFATSMPLALVNKPGFWFQLGVSRTLNVSYLKPIPCGSKILIECEIVGLGKTLGHTRGIMRRESDGVVLTTCEHGKFNSDLHMSKL